MHKGLPPKACKRAPCQRKLVRANVLSLPQLSWLSETARPGPTLDQLQLQTLQAQIDSLQAQLTEAQRRAQFAESRVASLEAHVQEGRALSLVHEAVQMFRQHVSGLPADVNTHLFYEDEGRIIGKGGQAVVYSWQDKYAVKRDPLPYKHAYNGRFEPERLADLLPAYLPPHPNVLAPKGWWVGTRSHRPQHPQHVQPDPKWVLYTLYDRFSCSLFDHVTGLRSSQAQPSPSEPLLLDLRSILVVIRDVAAALDHLAKHRVCHCDVKAENVLLVLEDDPHAKQQQPATHAGSSSGSAARQRIARAVLIDFGLARLLPAGVDKTDARGGTWMFKAPEQMSGPPGMAFGGQELPAQPYVCQATDVWSLGALICNLCHNGAVPSSPGLPWVLPPDQLVKWGDRPSECGGQEPFYMTWDSVLPLEPCQGPPAGDAAAPTVGAPILEALQGLAPAPAHTEECVLLDVAVQEQQAQQQAHVLALLRRLAWGCMQADPADRLTPAQVVQAADAALRLVA